MKKITLILVLTLVLSIVGISGCLSDPLADFKGPNYIPDNYNNVKNNTTENGKILFYQGSAPLNFFMVAAVKDPDKKVIENLKKSFNSTDSPYVQSYNETQNINDHQVTLQIESMNFFGVPISVFSASWYCDRADLTYATLGMVPTGDLDEMKKMMQSIQCHNWLSF